MPAKRKPPVFTPSPVPVLNGDIIGWARAIVKAALWAAAEDAAAQRRAGK